MQNENKNRPVLQGTISGLISGVLSGILVTICLYFGGQFLDNFFAYNDTMDKIENVSIGIKRDYLEQNIGLPAYENYHESEDTYDCFYLLKGATLRSLYNKDTLIGYVVTLTSENPRIYFAKNIINKKEKKLGEYTFDEIKNSIMTNGEKGGRKISDNSRIVEFDGYNLFKETVKYDENYNIISGYNPDIFIYYVRRNYANVGGVKDGGERIYYLYVPYGIETLNQEYDGKIKRVKDPEKDGPNSFGKVSDAKGEIFDKIIDSYPYGYGSMQLN